MMQRWIGVGLLVAAVVAQVACSSAADDGAGPPYVRTALDDASATGRGGAGPGGATTSVHKAVDGEGQENALGVGGSDSVPTGTGPMTGGADRRETPPPACVEAKASAALLPDPMHRVFYESADDSNSMGSPALVRELLRARIAPDPSTVRTYEFLNYYRVSHAAPPAGELGIAAEATLNPLAPAEVALHVAVRAADALAVRRPITITIALDASGSVAGVGLERERALVRAVAKRLRAGDVVSVVTWSTQESKILVGHAVKGPDDAAVIAAADAIRPTGGSDLHTGLVTAYEAARSSFDKSRLNRVLLVSDGGANLGVVDRNLIASAARDADKEGIYLAGVGIGPAPGYSDRLMNAITDAGRGAYVYLDSVEEAERMFVDRFDEVLGVAAREVQVALEVPYYVQIPDFFGEAYSENPADIDPQHLAPGGQMVFQQRLSLCAPGFTDPGVDHALRVTATWKDPITRVPRATEAVFAFDALTSAASLSLRKAQVIVDYAEALKVVGPEAPAALAAVYRRARELLVGEAFSKDPELEEIASLIALHPSFPEDAP